MTEFVVIVEGVTLLNFKVKIS